ncbi:Helix-turn-helix domain-containing protein [Parafrankia irregularis]|uniref:Helix-turn-helix domain-containing protein n=1 Tax=Parafrankia irregularis TaxID=795642 RepID=A0A0S4QTS6_9ACTN|nr:MULTISPECIES: helix-turn-helix transcriptional regulator [Parafrankia]MBE3203749.1 helix-turn-helix domain-containing protein [Parafrankia sp. CH37]CUU59008.1 Helix-turn-helix domain-containing protein [Parafrankia irregularis]
MTARNSGPTVRRRRLGAELRRLRETAGIEVEQACEALRCSTSKISRLENGRIPVRTRDVADLLALYGVPDGEHRAALLALARESRRHGWWQAYQDVVPAWFEVYIGLEADASSISVYEPQLVHGLLQTADYARAVMRASLPEASDDEIARRVALRLDRQSRLRDENPPRLWVILDEAVLRRPVGGTITMNRQLQQVAQAAELPNVTVQVLPFAVGAHAGLGSTFSVLSFADETDHDVVYIEKGAGSLYLERPSEIRRYRVRLDHLMASALSPADSLVLISDASEDFR